MKKLTKEGVGTETMRAQPLTPEQEEKLRCIRIFRCVLVGASPCNTVFWYNCKLFGLRGGDEHRSLVREQFRSQLRSARAVSTIQRTEGLYHRKPQDMAGRSLESDVVFPQTASGWLGGGGGGGGGGLGFCLGDELPLRI